VTVLALPAPRPVLRPGPRRQRVTRALTGLATRARLPELLLVVGRLSC